MGTQTRFVVSSVACIAAVVLISFAAHTEPSNDERHHRVAEHQHGQAANPLIEEMAKLDEVFRDVVSAVAVGNSLRVHEALEKMHGAMEKTHEGVRYGTVMLKKNADRMNEFLEQDKRFHGKLEELAAAAHRNDENAMLALTKELLDRCVTCHRQFRQA